MLTAKKKSTVKKHVIYISAFGSLRDSILPFSNILIRTLTDRIPHNFLKCN